MLLLRFGSIIGRRRFPSEIGVDDRDGMFGGRVDDESVVTFFSEEDSAREEARESVSSCCRSLERDSSLLSETTKSVVSIGDSRKRHRKHHEGHSKELEESERGENVGSILRVSSSGVGNESENGSEGRETVE